MISREPTLARLATAQSLLLEPFGLSPSHLQRALGEIMSHGVDDADLYFQTTRSEGWSLEEGIVKTGSFSIDQGVGVRAVSGEKTAFAYSDDLSWDSLIDAAHTVRSISAQGQGRKVRVPAVKVPKSRSLYPGLDPIATLDSTAKVALLEKVERMAKAKDPRVKQVMAGLASEYDVVLVARADGTLAADVRPLIRLSVTVIAEQSGRREAGSSGGGGRFGLAYFDDAMVQSYVDEAVGYALTNLDARPAPAGEMVVVLGSGWPGILLHEAVGHGLEGDFNRKGSSAYSGRMGEMVASKLCTIVDDGTLEGADGGTEPGAPVADASQQIGLVAAAEDERSTLTLQRDEIGAIPLGEDPSAADVERHFASLRLRDRDRLGAVGWLRWDARREGHTPASTLPMW